MTSEPVVVFAPNWLGDAVMALPAIADVRRHFGAAPLIIAARASVATLFNLVPGVDGVVPLQPRRGDGGSRWWHSQLSRFRRASDTAPGIAILLPNSFGSAWVARRAGFRERWGYGRDWRSLLLTRSIPVPRTSMHQARYYQHLTMGLGIPDGPLEPCVDVTDEVRERAAARLVDAGWDGRQPLVAMAPGAAYGTAKRWLPAHFAHVIAALARDGFRTVLVGSGADSPTVNQITTLADAPMARPLDLAGRTSLEELAGVLALSSACLSNDSGAMHLAGAIGIPIVALFGPTRETETAPLTRSGRRQDVLIHPVWCRPCMLRECPIDHRCMRGLEPARALASLRTMLG